MTRLRRRLSSQIFVYQLVILGATLLAGVLLALYAAQHRLDDEYMRRALGVAQSVAATPEIAAAVAGEDDSGAVQERAEAVRRATGVSFVVVTDARGIRYSHPVPERIGERVSTDPSEALAGRTVMAVETGTLGRSARAKVPLRDRTGRIVGAVSVGVLEQSIREDLGAIVPVIALYAGIALLVGLFVSLVLARRLKRQTFGLELGDLASLLREREAMLRGVREGVVATDPAGRLSVINAEARRLLDFGEDAVGRPVEEVVGRGRLCELLCGRLEGQDLIVVHNDRVLVANRRPVERDGRDLGAVVTLRDRTELEFLVRELDSIRDLTDAMRAQAHEFSNRLHTLSGLLQLGHVQEAIGFVREVAHADAAFRGMLEERVHDPLVASLLLAKSAVAGERGVRLSLTAGTRLTAELADARAVLTVLGNLVDNALDAAREGSAEPPWVEVGVRVEEGGVLHLRVEDSGPGVPLDRREAVFEPGWSTKPPGEIGARGVGLSLVRRLVERRGGAVEVWSGREGGAVFEVRIPVRIAPEAGARAQPAAVASEARPG